MNLKQTLDRLRFDLQTAKNSADKGEPRAVVTAMIEALQHLVSEADYCQCESCGDYLPRESLPVGVCHHCSDEARELRDAELEAYRWGRG